MLRVLRHTTHLVFAQPSYYLLKDKKVIAVSGTHGKTTVTTMIAHALLLAAIVITVATFETARRAPQYFGGYGRGAGGEHE